MTERVSALGHFLLPLDVPRDFEIDGIGFIVLAAAGSDQSVDVAVYVNHGIAVAHSGPTAGMFNTAAEKNVAVPKVTLASGAYRAAIAFETVGIPGVVAGLQRTPPLMPLPVNSPADWRRGHGEVLPVECGRLYTSPHPAYEAPLLILREVKSA